jgi:hypothetical protein
MNTRSIVATVAATTLLGLSATASAQRQDIVGTWRMQGTGIGNMSTSCDITFTTQEMFGSYVASSFGCGGALFGIDRYRFEGSDIVLMQINTPRAWVRLRGGQMVGADDKSNAVTLTRKGPAPGASPRPAPRPGGGGGRPSGDWDSGNNSGGWDDGGCIKHGDSTRCATQAEMAPPQVQTLLRANLRTSANLSAPVLQKLDKGTCVAVQECRQQGEQLWCKVQADGATGYMIQISPNINNPREKLLVFKNGCSNAF